MIRRPKTNKDIALQSHKILQMFAWWGLGVDISCPHHKIVCKILCLCRAIFSLT